MAIPDYQSIMSPLLDLVGDNETHRVHDAVDLLAQQFRWCRTCVRMLEADTGEVEWPHDESFAALEDACGRGLIIIRHR